MTVYESLDPAVESLDAKAERIDAENREAQIKAARAELLGWNQEKHRVRSQILALQDELADADAYAGIAERALKRLEAERNT